MKTDYEQRAQDFANKYGVTLKVGAKTWKKYFSSDKEARWVFSLTLSRLKNRNYIYYDFEFGQSLAKNGKDPTMYDVLSVLTKECPGSLENFCENMGMNPDSKKDNETFLAVWREWDGVNRLFSDVLEELREIE